jgi:hypothetical protein
MLQIERSAGTRDAMAASSQWLTDTLSAQQVSYDDFVMRLQAS